MNEIETPTNNASTTEIAPLTIVSIVSSLVENSISAVIPAPVIQLTRQTDSSGQVRGTHCCSASKQAATELSESLHNCRAIGCAVAPIDHSRRSPGRDSRARHPNTDRGDRNGERSDALEIKAASTSTVTIAGRAVDEGDCRSASYDGGWSVRDGLHGERAVVARNTQWRSTPQLAADIFALRSLEVDNSSLSARLQK